MLVETSNASESIETTTLEPKTEFSNVVAEDDIKMEDTKEVRFWNMNFNLIQSFWYFILCFS